MRRRLGCLVVLAAALAGSPAGAVAGPTGAAQPTVLVNVRPVTGAGDLAGGYTITAQLGRGHCETGSEATGNAYRCFSGKSKVLDPCWVTSTKGVVDCLAKPWKHNVIQLKVTKGYANYRPGKRSTALPWGLQLADGTQCLRLQGFAKPIDGTLESYKCFGTKKVLAGEVIKRGTVWKIHEASKTSHGYRLGPKVPVAQEWLGRSSLKGR